MIQGMLCTRGPTVHCVHIYIWEVGWMLHADLMSHSLGPGDTPPPPPLKVSRGHVGNIQKKNTCGRWAGCHRPHVTLGPLTNAETRDKGGGWTSHRSCLSTASSCALFPHILGNLESIASGFVLGGKNLRFLMCFCSCYCLEGKIFAWEMCKERLS